MRTPACLLLALLGYCLLNTANAANTNPTDPLQPLFKTLPRTGRPVYSAQPPARSVTTPVNALPRLYLTQPMPDKSANSQSESVKPGATPVYLPTGAIDPLTMPTRAPAEMPLKSPVQGAASPVQPVPSLQAVTPAPPTTPIQSITPPASQGKQLTSPLDKTPNVRVEPVSEADKANGYGQDDPPNQKKETAESPVALTPGPTPGPNSPTNPAAQPAVPGVLTADQLRRLSALSQDISTGQLWLADALSINQLQPNQNLPTERILGLWHQATVSQLWQRFHQANVQYEPSLNKARQAKQLTSEATLLASPSFRVEGRALWLDRGSIVASQTPEGLRNLLRRIHKLGINTLFVETMNAGYATYKSQMIPMNPLLTGDWDPLAVAVETGHQLGMEVHAWVWCFAVGNVRHNVIVNQSADYAGPILVEKGMMPEALRGASGNLIPRKGVQHEFWLSPASSKAQTFLIDTYREIVSKYAVDGLQLDYIRYPFQNSVHQMGYESIGRQRFEEETGLYLNAMDDYTLKSFIAWKTYQVTKFVEQVATTLKGLNPQLKISAAVYPMHRAERIVAIQQDWETWLDKGWVDFLAPMTYTPSPKEYQSTLTSFKTTTQKPAIIYPGIALHRLDGPEVCQLQQITRQSGWQGNTLFANAHLDRSTETALTEETYRTQPAIPPHRNPALSARLIVQDTLQMTDTLNRLGDHQYDDWQPVLKQTDAALTAWSAGKSPSDTLKALQPTINSMAQNSLKASKTMTPYRQIWMGTQMSRLSQLLGVVARLDAPSPSGS